jgi:hypothetical protein
LSVSLGLSALATGVRILPLSITLLAAAIGIPRLVPDASPRRVVRLGLGAMFAGIVVLLGAIDADVSTQVTTAVLQVNRDARVAGLRSALAVLALIALGGLFSARRIPTRQPASSPG